MAQLVTVSPLSPQRSSSCSISFINTSTSIIHSSFERFSLCRADSLVRSQWRFTNGVTSAAIRNESPPGEVSVQRHFDSFLFTNIVCASCSSSTQSTRDLHARLLRASRMRTRMKTRRGGGRRVVNGFCRGATIPAISICDNQIMRSSPRADYQFVPFNFMLINSPRFLFFFLFVLTCEKNLTKIYNTNAIIKITTKQLSQQFRLTNQIN